MTNTTPQNKIKIDGSATTERLREIAKSVGAKHRDDFQILRHSPRENLAKKRERGEVGKNYVVAWEDSGLGVMMDYATGKLAIIHSEKFEDEKRLATPLINSAIDAGDSREALRLLKGVGLWGNYDKQITDAKKLRVGDCILFINTYTKYTEYTSENGWATEKSVGLVHGWIKCLERGYTTRIISGNGIDWAVSNCMMLQHGCLKTSRDYIPEKFRFHG